MPGELNIISTLLGPENRTLVGSRSDNDTTGLGLITLDFDIRVFSNETAYNLSFTQVNSMDVVDDYSITAEVSFTVTCRWVVVHVYIPCLLILVKCHILGNCHT